MRGPKDQNDSIGQPPFIPSQEMLMFTRLIVVAFLGVPVVGLVMIVIAALVVKG